MSYCTVVCIMKVEKKEEEVGGRKGRMEEGESKREKDR
jgi:hypothetical protein